MTPGDVPVLPVLSCPATKCILRCPLAVGASPPRREFVEGMTRAQLTREELCDFVSYLLFSPFANLL
jgi:hypothetical protein